jgi:hypothetical protein
MLLLFVFIIIIMIPCIIDYLTIFSFPVTRENNLPVPLLNHTFILLRHVSDYIDDFTPV